MATPKQTNKPTATPFTWPKPPKQLFADYLKANVSGDADAPHRGLPFITEKGVLRVKPSHSMTGSPAARASVQTAPEESRRYRRSRTSGSCSGSTRCPPSMRHGRAEGQKLRALHRRSADRHRQAAARCRAHGC